MYAIRSYYDTKCETAGVTANLDVKYKNPLFITDKEIIIRAKVDSINKRIAVIKATIEDGEGKICAEGNISYFIFPKEVAEKKYMYPGVNAFYE